MHKRILKAKCFFLLYWEKLWIMDTMFLWLIVRRKRLKQIHKTFQWSKMYASKTIRYIHAKQTIHSALRVSKYSYTKSVVYIQRL